MENDDEGPRNRNALIIQNGHLHRIRNVLGI